MSNSPNARRLGGPRVWAELSRPDAEQSQRFLAEALALLLADLREIRQKKFAFSFGMIDSASATLAVPLRDSDGRVVAAMNVVGPMTEFGTDAIRDRILPALTDIAAPPVVLPALISGRQSYRKEHLA